jgi:hypothetical protein
MVSPDDFGSRVSGNGRHSGGLWIVQEDNVAWADATNHVPGVGGSDSAAVVRLFGSELTPVASDSVEPVVDPLSDQTILPRSLVSAIDAAFRRAR